MLEMGLPVGAGTDGTRVASYNPWVALYWLTTGKTVGDTPLYGESNLLSREEALRLYTQGSSWFSSEENSKGTIAEGQLADLTALSADYFSVPDEQIKYLESVLTVVGGRIVYGADEFSTLSPPLPTVSSDCSPVHYYGGYHKATVPSNATARSSFHPCTHAPEDRFELWTGWSGCDCFAF
jgi:hypothetical protein